MNLHSSLDLVKADSQYAERRASSRRLDGLRLGKSLPKQFCGTCFRWSNGIASIYNIISLKTLCHFDESLLWSLNACASVLTKQPAFYSLENLQHLLFQEVLYLFWRKNNKFWLHLAGEGGSEARRFRRDPHRILQEFENDMRHVCRQWPQVAVWVMIDNLGWCVCETSYLWDKGHS